MEGLLKWNSTLEQFSESQAAFGTYIGGFLYAATNFLKRNTGRIFRISKWFTVQEAAGNLYLLSHQYVSIVS